MLARSYVWWEGMDSDIEKKIASCEACQLTQNNSSPKVYVPLAKSDTPWQRVHIDFLDTQKAKILLLVDEGSKWVEGWIFGGTSASQVIEKLEECFSRFGYPQVIVSDNGPPFSSRELQHYCASRNIQHIFSPPYHPASNGEGERMVQELKKLMVRSVISEKNSKQKSLANRLSECLAAYRFTPSTVTKSTPAEVMLKFPVRTFLSMLLPNDKFALKSTVSDIQSIRQFKVNDKVLVRNPKQGLYKWVGARVMEKIGTVVYLVRLLSGVVRKVHINQIKKSDLPESSHPPIRGTSEDTWLVPPPSPVSPRRSTATPVTSPSAASPPAPGRPIRIRRPPSFFSSAKYQ
ncbi:Hypothetical Protein NTJ_14475 [Nesidiocoris tenuis]|uniref:RNA-directed DNA polymerase n=1 Tax=Nesidiocoris tenuis TaxID=355587 RepID=A0ABN7BBE9_9HEMI|nr:Hypothetical Protein NTJ_14475 [Nesidiocoris tenuis]